MKKIMIIVIILIFGGTGISCICQCRKPEQKNPVVEKSADGVISSATFHCMEGKTIQALFFKDKVELILSDGRNMLLLRAVSADGERYANTDESVVFWSKGDTAFIEEGNKATFKDCRTTGSK
jgi:membrane-bound inhibitor of C-type lysozyme